MTEKQFRDNPELRNELATLLNLPCLTFALEILSERAKVRKKPNPMPGMHIDTRISHVFHQKLGIQETIDALRALAQPNPPPGEENVYVEEEEYLHASPQDIQDATRVLRALQKHT